MLRETVRAVSMGMCAELFHSASGHLERSRAGGDLHYSAVQAHSQALTFTFKEITVLPHGLFREKALIRCRTGAYAFFPPPSDSRVR